MPSPQPPLEITKENWRKTGVTRGGFGSGKGSRIPATGQNLDLRRQGHDRINWRKPYCRGCLGDAHTGPCPS